MLRIRGLPDVTAVDRPPAGEVRYLALGDSFTIGTGITPDRAFPAVLAERWRAGGLAVALSDPAVNGYATDDLIREELPLVARLRPTIVTLLIGANDIVRSIRAGTPAPAAEARYRSQVRSIHDALREHVAPERVYALPQPDWSLSPAAAAFGEPAALGTLIERWNGVARDEAERAGARYLDLFPLMRDQARRGMLAPDGLHPSADAHAGWAAAIDGLLTIDRAPGSPRR